MVRASMYGSSAAWSYGKGARRYGHALPAGTVASSPTPLMAPIMLAGYRSSTACSVRLRTDRAPLQRRRGAASSRARRYMSAGRTSRPRSQPDRTSTETPSFLASGASPPQSCKAPARARIWGEGLAMGCIFGWRVIPRRAVANIEGRAVAKRGCRQPSRQGADAAETLGREAHHRSGGNRSQKRGWPRQRRAQAAQARAQLLARPRYAQLGTGDRRRRRHVRQARAASAAARAASREMRDRGSGARTARRAPRLPSPWQSPQQRASLPS